MKLSEYLISHISPQIIKYGSGNDLVKLFNQFGFKDIYSYDDGGLPDIGKKNGQRPSKTQYVNDRLNRMSTRNDGTLRECLQTIVNKIPEIIENIQDPLKEEGYIIENFDGGFFIQGGVIINSKPVINEAYFQDIQNKILTALDGAKVSIKVLMAWFTNEALFDKLVEKHKQGVDVEISIYDDGVNRKHGVDITQLPHKRIKRGKRGGLMHDKFCVIDNQVVISGSYNWTNNAEFRNDENITVERDPDQATRFSVEYKRLTSIN